jgi:hypothetical protein
MFLLRMLLLQVQSAMKAEQFRFEKREPLPNYTAQTAAKATPQRGKRTALNHVIEFAYVNTHVAPMQALGVLLQSRSRAQSALPSL